MSDKYKIFDGDEAYFVTFTIVDWIKVLADDSYKLLIIDAIKFYQTNKGLVVYGYCIMPNHVHMIIQAVGKFSISEILRDLKKFTARAIVNKLEQDKPEGYMDVLSQFSEAGKPLKRITNYKVWQDGNMAKLLYSNKFLMEKLSYIHNNPVEYGLCSTPWEYKFSSASNYADKDSLIKVELLSLW
ncbi:MAG: transposase [Bacteroidales bacterium]|nr:transposase [Bacteroidales bacterium]